MRLWAIVDSLVTGSSEKAAYVAFAQELMLAQRRSARPDNSGVRMQKSECRIDGDMTDRMKRVVEKWFRRGLSGHLMWLVGRAVLG
jgi:hypothetical protein